MLIITCAIWNMSLRSFLNLRKYSTTAVKNAVKPLEFSQMPGPQYYPILGSINDLITLGKNERWVANFSLQANVIDWKLNWISMSFAVFERRKEKESIVRSNINKLITISSMKLRPLWKRDKAIKNIKNMTKGSTYLFQNSICNYNCRSSNIPPLRHEIFI